MNMRVPNESLTAESILCEALNAICKLQCSCLKANNNNNNNNNNKMK